MVNSSLGIGSRMTLPPIYSAISLLDMAHALLRVLVAIFLAVLALLAPFVAQAQMAGDSTSNVQSGETSVAITFPSALSNTGDLDFGTIITGNAPGSVTIAPDGEVTTAGDVISMGGTRPAGFLLEKGAYTDFPTAFSPILPETVEIVNENDASATMTIRNLTTDFNRRRPYFVIFSVPAWWGVTNYDFRVGGTLDVDANQKSGVYTGTFEVQVDFQ